MVIQRTKSFPIHGYWQRKLEQVTQTIRKERPNWLFPWFRYSQTSVTWMSHSLVRLRIFREWAENWRCWKCWKRYELPAYGNGEGTSQFPAEARFQDSRCVPMTYMIAWLIAEWFWSVSMKVNRIRLEVCFGVKVEGLTKFQYLVDPQAEVTHSDHSVDVNESIVLPASLCADVSSAWMAHHQASSTLCHRAGGQDVS